MEKIPLSVVMIAKNEEKGIAESLQSVTWVDEVIVIDDFSTDRTAEIAKRYGARVIQKKMEVEGKHRNEFYALALHEWVLSLDADERVSPELKEEITKILKNDTPHAGFSIPPRNYIGDR